MSLSITQNGNGSITITCGSDTVTLGGSPSVVTGPVPHGASTDQRQQPDPRDPEPTPVPDVVIKVAGDRTRRAREGVSLEDIIDAAIKDHDPRRRMELAMPVGETMHLGRVKQQLHDRLGPNAGITMTFWSDLDG